jgi:hypothetical protein
MMEHTDDGSERNKPENDPIIVGLERTSKRIIAILHVALSAIFAVAVLVIKAILVVGLIISIYKVESAFSAWVGERLNSTSPVIKGAP